MEQFEQFRQIVLQDSALQERLREVSDPRRFVELVVQLGGERGCQFSAEDVEVAMRANRRTWMQHRMVA